MTVAPAPARARTRLRRPIDHAAAAPAVGGPPCGPERRRRDGARDVGRAVAGGDIIWS
ncbi:hypothetical protein RB200_29195 [Streptomyces sp. PmtG]